MNGTAKASTSRTFKNDPHSIWKPMNNQRPSFLQNVSSIADKTKQNRKIHLPRYKINIGIGNKNLPHKLTK